jgi:23S rRNA (adenine2503-C2)-methyltransferase
VRDVKSITDLALAELKAELEAMGEPAFRAKQIFDWIYKKGAASFERMTNLPAAFREKLAASFSTGGLELLDLRRSKDGTEKYLFRLSDGPAVEAVVIPSRDRTTICLSTQAGCKFACVFCASGRMGFIRNLTPGEIVGQVLFLRDHLEVAPTNLVFMGMGEPFDNYDNLARAIAILNSPDGLAIAARRMTVSTAGVVPAIERFKELGAQVNLSISLHAVTDAKRDALMPINRKYPLGKLLAAATDYVRGGGRKITLEYILIKGINDGEDDAVGLVRIAGRLRAKVNVIVLSPIPGVKLDPPDGARVAAFLKVLNEKKVPATLRQSKGREIQAACGQLAGRAAGKI